MVLGRLGRAAFSYGWTALASTEAIAVQALRPDAATMERHTRRWARVLVRSWRLELAVDGMERIPRDRACVIVANHQSYLDVIALFATMPLLPVFLAKRELERAPLFGRAMQLGGHVFVDRGKHDRAMESMERAGRQLRPGKPLAIFPEGTRAKVAGVRPFKKGAFHLARSVAAPIVPIGIRGSLEAWPRSEVAPLPDRSVSLRVGEPIASDDGSSIEALAARARSEVARLAGLPLLDA